MRKKNRNPSIVNWLQSSNVWIIYVSVNRDVMQDKNKKADRFDTTRSEGRLD